jgi:hypothetical protein
MKGDRALDDRGLQEWLVVLGVGLGGLALAALATLTPWHGGGAKWQPHPFGSDRVIDVHVPVVLQITPVDPR